MVLFSLIMFSPNQVPVPLVGVVNWAHCNWFCRICSLINETTIDIPQLCCCYKYKCVLLLQTNHPDSWTDYGCGNHCNKPASSCAYIATGYQCLRHKANESTHFCLMCSPPAAGSVTIQTLVWHSLRLYSVW